MWGWVGVSTLQAQTQYPIPANARTLCSKAPITVTRLTSVNSGIPSGSCFVSPPKQPYWLRFTPSESGSFEFVVKPMIPSSDFDFVLFEGDPATGGQEIICDYASPFLPTGIASNPSAFGVFPNVSILNFPVFVDAGQEYYLLVDNYTANAGGFTIEFGGSFKIHPNDVSNGSVQNARSCADAPTFDCECFQDFESGTERMGYTATDIQGFGAPLNNPHVYKFKACACVMDFEVFINGPCVTGFGLEAQILDGACGGTPVVDINNGAPGTPCQLLAQNLIVGQEYTLVIDGQNGASCPYVIRFVESTPPPLGFQDTLYTPTEYFCEGDTIGIWTDNVENVAICYWATPPGFDTLPSVHDTLYFVAEYTGSPQTICLFLNNGCGDNKTICRTIEVLPDTTTELSVGLCAGDLPFIFQGDTLTTFGVYSDTLSSQAGCDSFVVLTLFEVFYCPPQCPTGAGSAIIPSDTCAHAPLLCGNYLDGYCGQNYTSEADSMHSAWLRIPTCSDSLTLSVGVSHCVDNQGVIVSLLSGDCIIQDTFGTQMPVAYGFIDTLKWSSVPPDSILFLRIQGIGGDQCQFDIRVLDGIGTAEPLPGTCACTGGGITGPSSMCPGQTATFMLTPSSCTITGGGSIGGNGYACLPEEACPSGDTGNLVPVWHFSSPSIQFLGDSVGYSVNVQLDPALSQVDTFINIQVTITWEDTTSNPIDTLDYEVYCDCGGTPCSGGGPYNFNFTASHTFIEKYCTLTCINPVCYVDGQIYWTPGIYTISQDPCVTVIVYIMQDINQPNVFIQSSSNSICVGEQVVLTAIPSSFYVSFQWSNGQTLPEVNVTPSSGVTNFTVTVTDQYNGCTYAVTQSIQAFLPNWVNLPDQTICAGDTIYVADNIITAPGNYSFTIPNQFGCDSTITINVFSGGQTIQQGNIGTLSCATPSLAHLGQTYTAPGTYSVPINCDFYIFSINFLYDTVQHGNIGAISCAQPCLTFMGQQFCAAGNYSITDSCAIHYFNVINVLDTIQHDTIGGVSCAQPCVTFLGQQFCAAGNYSIVDSCAIHYFNVIHILDTIQHDTIGIISCPNPCVVLMGQQFCAAGNYSITDSCAIHYFSVIQNTTPPVAATATPICLTDGTFTVSFTITGQPPFTVNGQFVSGANFTSAPFADGATYTLVVTQTNNGCTTVVTGTHSCPVACSTTAGVLSSTTLSACAGQQTIQAQVLTPPVLMAGQGVEFVLRTPSGTVLARNATGVFDFMPNAMTTGTMYEVVQIVGPMQTNSTVNLQDPCTRISNPQPVEYQSIVQWMGVEAISPICMGDANGSIRNIELTNGQAPYTYRINNVAAQSPDAFERLLAGTYALEVSDAHGCVADTMVTLVEGVALSVEITQPQPSPTDPAIFAGDSVTLAATVSGPVSDISWTTDPVGNTHTGTTEWSLRVMEPMSVICTAKSANGCTVTDRMALAVREDGSIYHPNVIQPLNAQSAENQRFTIYAPEGWIQTIEHLAIYDRWGTLCWEGHQLPPNDPASGWAGTTRGGRAAASGVYVFMAQVRLNNGKIQEIKGDVTVLR
jgi:hypothetical protein